MRSGEVRHDARRKHRSGALTVGELAGERADGRSLPGLDLGRQRNLAGPRPGHPPVTRFPAHRAARRAALPAASWSAWASASQGARQTAKPAHSSRRRADSSSSQAASPVSGNRSLITSIPSTPSTASASADSAVRVRRMVSVSAPGCDASPSVTAIRRSRAPPAASTAIVPPTPSTSSSGWAAMTTTLGQACGLAAGSCHSSSQDSQASSGVPGRSMRFGSPRTR